MMLPYYLIIDNIIPYISLSNHLIKFKCVNKYFNKKIICHHPKTLYRKCYNCIRHGFRVINDNKRCAIKNCIAKDIFHPFNLLKDKYGNDYCSENCLVNRKKKK